jgi:hypothetical protein
MSSKAKYEVIILFPSELRTAAKLIQVAQDMAKADPKSEETWKAFTAAFRAAHVALWHLGQPEADRKCVMVAGEPVEGDDAVASEECDATVGSRNTAKTVETK